MIGNVPEVNLRLCKDLGVRFGYFDSVIYIYKYVLVLNLNLNIIYFKIKIIIGRREMCAYVFWCVNLNFIADILTIIYLPK